MEFITQKKFHEIFLDRHMRVLDTIYQAIEVLSNIKLFKESLLFEEVT